MPSLHLSQQLSNKSRGRNKPPRMKNDVRFEDIISVQYAASVLQRFSGNQRINTKYFQTLRYLFLAVKIH